MTLTTNLQNFATRAATEDKALRSLINGNVSSLSSLSTTAKTNLVAALNELKGRCDTLAASLGAQINDASSSSSTTTWSTSKISSAISAAVAQLVSNSPSTLDTLNELANALGNDPSFATTVSDALGNRVRTDVATQGLTSTQQTNATTNIGAATVATVGDTTVDLVSVFNTALA